MRINAKSEWQGDHSIAPRWVRAHIIPWYRRILTRPETLFFTTLIGIIFGAMADSNIETILAAPSLVLLLLMAADTYKEWLREQFQRAVDEGKIKSGA